MPQSLNGKTALVTGASRGISRTIAERLAADGATVALTYSASKTGANEAVAAIERAGGMAFALQADLVDAASIPALFDELDRELTNRKGSNKLDILVNNAGNAGWGGLADATPVYPSLGFVHQVVATKWGVRGSSRRRRPVALAMALAIAAGVGPWEPSPAPKKGAPGRSMRWTSIFSGTSEKRMMG